MLDIDNFKQINDTHGHMAGDEVLREVARRLENTARRGDTVGRFGGEEFLIVLSLENVAAAEVAAERYRTQIGAMPIVAGDLKVSVTVSVGAGIVTDSTAFMGEEIVKLADEALYEAKIKGRNRCIVHSA